MNDERKELFVLNEDLFKSNSNKQKEVISLKTTSYISHG